MIIFEPSVDPSVWFGIIVVGGEVVTELLCHVMTVPVFILDNQAQCVYRQIYGQIFEVNENVPNYHKGGGQVFLVIGDLGQN